MSTATPALPLDALGEYLRDQGLADAGPIQATVLTGGQSNPTYRLTMPDGRQYALRTKPPGVLLASAHAIDREYRVMHALRDSAVPGASSWTNPCPACHRSSAMPSTVK